MELGLAKLAAVYERPQRKNYTELLERLKARRTGSEAELGLAKILGLAKLATSFDARRTKQYWQLLKRLHGGNDEAVQAIKETRDPGIYHGTTPVRADQALQDGLHPGQFREFGTGTFFGDRHIATRYLHDLPDGQDDMRGMVRLALPSELRGTQHLYPDVQKAKVFDIQGPDAIAEVAPRQLYYLKESSPLFERYGRMLEHRFDQMNNDQLREIGLRISPNTNPAIRWDAPQPKSFLRRNLVEQRAEDYAKVETPEAQRSLQTYGKLHGQRLFEINDPKTKRKEFFFDQTPVPPHLLRKEN